MIAAFLLESGQRTLALRDLAWSKLQVEIPSVVSLLGTGRKAVTMDQLPIALIGGFASREASLVEQLVPILTTELEEAEQTELFRRVEMPLVPVLADMEQTGIAVDLAYLAELGRELNERLGDLESEIYRHVGHDFNINSTQRLSEVLFQELHLETQVAQGQDPDRPHLDRRRRARRAARHPPDHRADPGAPPARRS